MDFEISDPYFITRKICYSENFSVKKIKDIDTINHLVLYTSYKQTDNEEYSDSLEKDDDDDDDNHFSNKTNKKAVINKDDILVNEIYKLPKHVIWLTLSDGFNWTIIYWPEHITKLTFGDDFNQLMTVYPPNLEYLKF